MNLGDLRTRVLENLGDDGATWAPSDAEGGDRYARIDRIINDAQQELVVLAERVDPTFNVKDVSLPITGESWTQLDVVGVLPAHQYTALPSDFRRIISLWRAKVTTGPWAEMQIVPRRQALHYGGLSITVPEVAYLRNEAGTGSTTATNRIYIVGSPTSHGWQLWYAAQVADLADEYDVCQLPTEYHHLVALGATVKALLQEHSDASYYKTTYDQAIQTMAVALPRRDGAGAPY